MDPAPFIRGCVFNGTSSVAYPRADPTDTRIPRDTWQTAQLPVGMRVEVTGDLDRGAYRIQKLIYETQPGFPVTGLLYLPKDAPDHPAGGARG